MPQRTYDEKKAEFIADDTLRRLHNGSADEKMWKVSWGHVDLEIWKVWKIHGTSGEGVRVAVIDTGVSLSENDLANRVSASSVSLVDNSIDDHSSRYHGTMSAGLIGADGRTAQTVFGVAPGCELLIIKAGQEQFYPTNIQLALQKAMELEAKIVSMSIEGYSHPSEEMAKLVQQCADNEMILLAASGDLGDESTSYPACYSGCLSVGAYYLDEKGRRNVWKGSNRNGFVRFLAPGDRVLTCSPSMTPVLYDGTSAATAFTAGIMALAVAAAKSAHINYSVLMDALQKGTCTAIDTGKKPPTQDEGYGVITPLSLISYLINSN